MRSNIIKYVFFIIIAILLAFAIYKVNFDNNETSGNTGTVGSGQEQDITREIRIAIAGLDTMNPILSKNRNVQDVSRLIFEPLINLTYDFKAEGCLATEWAKAEGNSYIIKLRNDVKWSNGEMLNAQDVRYTIDRLKDTNSIYSPSVQNVIGVDVIDDNTVRIKLDSDVPFFEYNLTFPIVSKSYFGETSFSDVEKNKKIIGTGKFKITEFNQSNLVLCKNENWWNTNENNNTLEKITININSSMAEVYNAFKMGNIDFINTANMDYTKYIGTLGYSTKEYTGREHGFLAFNTQSPLASNLEVRKAVQYAIDKSNINGNVFGGKYYITDFPLGFGSWLNTIDANLSLYNLEKANKTLEDSGWTLRNGLWQITENRRFFKLNLRLLVKSSDPTRVAIANVIQAQLAQVGIGVDINAVSDSTFNSRLAAKDYDMVLLTSNVSANPNLSTYYGSNNFANYNNNEVTTILKEVNNTTDENILKEKYKRLKEIYENDVPYISLYISKNVIIYNTNLAGEVSPNWYNPFYNVESWYK